MSKLRILHLSDLHIPHNDGQNFFRSEQLFEEIVACAETYKFVGQIDMVAVTGDVVNHGEVIGGFGNAKILFDKLAHELSIEPKKFIFVPGNHDVRGNDLLEQIGAPTDDLDNYVGRFYHFQQFVKDFSGNNGTSSYGVTQIEAGNHVIRVMKINSVLYSRSDKGSDVDRGKLHISTKQLEDIERQWRSLSKNSSIALMHHSPDWLDTKQKRLLESMLTRNKVSFFLHGHSHENFIEQKETPASAIFYLCTGLGFPAHTEYEGCKRYKMSYYVIDLKNETVAGQMFVTGNDLAFTTDTVTFPPDGKFEFRRSTVSKRTRAIPKSPSSSKKAVNPTKKFTGLTEQEDEIQSLVRQKEALERQKGVLKDQVAVLEQLICKGIKFLRNDAMVFFNTQKQLYEFTFTKEYEIITGNHQWFSGQFYCNRFQTDRKKSTAFYKKHSAKISWNQLNFRASITVKASNKKPSKLMPALVECVAESANYKQFNIKYASADELNHYECKINDTVILEYKYEVPVDCWGSYLNRTISYFNETWKVTFDCDVREQLEKGEFSLTRKPDVEVSERRFKKSKEGFYFVKGTESHRMGHYVIHWNAEAIFGVEGINSARGEDKSQITRS